jgi:predicted DNA-binding transcriptional regulator AlpA
LGRVVCVRGFCALLGMTQRTFYREINGALDLRRRIDELGALRP